MLRRMRLFRYVETPDLISAVFLLALVSVVLVARGRLTDWEWLLARYLTLLLLQGVVTVGRGRGLPPILTGFFPIVPILGIYDSLRFIPQLNPVDRDGILIQIDQVLLGRDPSLWLESISAPWLTELLQVSYLVYYFLPFVLLGILYSRRHVTIEESGPTMSSGEAFDLCIVALLLSHYLAFVGYMVMPALGPRFAQASQYQTELTGLLLAEPIRHLLDTLEGIKRDAFPSGHTSAALICLYYAFRFAPRLSRYALPAVGLMILATVYLRYHYVADILGGAILAVLCILLAPRFLRLEPRKSKE